jgi:hypothetical protein
MPLNNQIEKNKSLIIKNNHNESPVKSDRNKIKYKDVLNTKEA